jgi:hypothetical protein
MADVILTPNSDAGPNDYSPAPAVAHYLNVDENPHDSDTSYLSASTSFDREVFGLDTSGLAADSVISSVRIRVTWKPGANFGSYAAGFIIGGVDYFGALHPESGGDPYGTAEYSWLLNPATGLAWTKAALTAASLVHEQRSFTIGIPRPRLTQCIVIAAAVTPPQRPTAVDVSVAPGGTMAAGNVHGSVAAPRGPSATGQALVPTAPPTSPNHKSAAAAATVPYGTAAAVLPSATPTELP